jgi:hypothetical protein
MSTVSFSDSQKVGIWPDGQTHNCRITRDSVYIDDVRLPDYIAENGVTVLPGGRTDFNRVTVTFIVSEVTVEDAAVSKVTVTKTPDDVPGVLSAYTELEVTPAKGNEG